MRKRGKILFGVLNWGLGHATRSIPVIQQLLAHNYEVVLASDGAALALLQREFPELIFEKLPAYNIRYSRNPRFFTLKLLAQTPHILKIMQSEKKIVQKLVDKHQINLIISDNRFGFKDPRISNIYITHQLNVLSGWTTPLTTYLHRRIYRQFDEIWVPDYAGEINLSGRLGHLKKKDSKIKYIGSLHRIQKIKTTPKYEVLVILSGPEPQRSLLEKELIKQLSKLNLKSALIQGLVNESGTLTHKQGIDIYNYLTRKNLQKLINTSEVIISRPGYTSIMDLALISKKIIWIPTPGQKEQEYLALYHQKKYGFVCQKQTEIKLNNNIINTIPATAISLEKLYAENIIPLTEKFLDKFDKKSE